MKLGELLSDISILSANVDLDIEITGVSYDSRLTRPGDLFIAVVGFATDGHKYINKALEQGAAAVLCQTVPEGEGVPFVRTADTRLALALVSRRWFGFPAERMKLVGITGTNGKTTTTLLIKHILETTQGAKVGLIGTNGNKIGDTDLPSERTTPESFELQRLFRQMADAGCTHVVMEVSSHALALDRVAGLRYAVAAFTNLTQDHLDFHGTMEAYAEAKAKLFRMADSAVVNHDAEYGPYFTERAACPVFEYGVNGERVALNAAGVELLPDRVRFRASCGEESVPVELGIPGAFSVYNALCALLCCMRLGVSLRDGSAALKTAKGVQGRMETVPTDGDYTILIDYAHTPDALENVLRAVRETAPGRVVALFGCGGDRDRTKRPIMGRIAVTEADLTVVTSDNPRTEDPMEIIREILSGINAPQDKYVTIPDRREAIAWAIEHHRPGDVIVLAGKGHETYQEIDHVKHHMDEREIVAEILERRKHA
ncbi:MAG: UDP-N-acetylmuramoyl-L-alanyl-D-glutamate--2,6-diaminopimelate ligase [Oscillospiraceae bacterium]|nr:UDP-N-acetylmuramoyl-L-alanyl-D-glutamate--2,6-diaminopimelate ligase [Oscillospiraceae bacterium]